MIESKDPERIWMSKTEALAYVQRVYHRFPLWMARRCGRMPPNARR